MPWAFSSSSTVRAADTRPLVEDEGRYLNYPIFTFDEQKLFETYRIVMKAGSALSTQPHMKGVVEYVTVFSGEVDITVAGDQVRLTKGDSIRFAADVPHAYQNSGEETAERLEASLRAAGPVTELLKADPDPEALLRAALPGLALEVLEKRPIAYRCDCSRERMERALISLGREELRAMIDEQGSAELTCRFCDNVQRFSREELEALLASC